MRVAVASGKGGTGKTTIATSLASLLARSEDGVTYIDCDAEEPDGHLLLRPDIEAERPVEVPVPVFDRDACTRCGECVNACQFNALALAGGEAVTFVELCHGCGACELACPTGAITLGHRTVGTIRFGHKGPLRFVEGRMNVGEASVTPIIRALRETISDGISVLDAPPGTACPAVEALTGADRAVLVTEPTPFGLHDLRLAVDVARQLELPVAVVINRCDIGDDRVLDYCRQESVDVLLSIENSREIAEAYASGELPLGSSAAFRRGVEALAETILAWSREPARS
jgi:MinD superfamily P-loop ATPase